MTNDTSVRTLRVDGKFIVRLPSRRRAFLKACMSDWPAKDALFRALVRERACIEHLQGLAVPTLISAPAGVLPPPFNRADRKGAWILLEDHGRDFGHIGLRREEILASNLFVLEQLVAFRRCQILYTDVKCANVVARKRPLRITVIDFNCAVVYQKAATRWSEAGFTNGFEPPEMGLGGIRSERSLVYQWAMMVVHTMSRRNLDNKRLSGPRGLSGVVKVLESMRVPGIGSLVTRSLSERPSERPRNYEVALQDALSATLPDAVIGIWRQLRAPYRERLAELGLTL